MHIILSYKHNVPEISTGRAASGNQRTVIIVLHTIIILIAYNCNGTIIKMYGKEKEKMKCKYYIVDAFTEEQFKGNQAGVCLLEQEIESTVMQNIAAENNLAETAFLVKRNGEYDLRWFTPVTEMDLCGHATLASAYVLSHLIEPENNIMFFNTKSGKLKVTKKDDLLELEFPTRSPKPIPVTSLMERALEVKVAAAYMARDLLVIVESEEEVRNLKPNFDLLQEIPDAFGIIVSAKGNEADFVSRFFAPKAGVLEDSVTGSAHTTLIPYWAEKLGKEEMLAKQLSQRGGTLYCKNESDHVKIAGKAVLYLSGIIHF